MEIANREQAEHWNSGDDAGHWVTKQVRYDGMLAGVDAATVAQAEASVRAALAPFATDDGVYLGAAVWLVRATA